MVHLVSLNQKQLVFLTNGGLGAGQYKLTFNAQQTGDINHDATAATIEAALELLPNINVGDVAVTYDTGYDPTTSDKAVLIEFKGQYAQAIQNLVTIASGTAPLTDYTTAVTQKYGPLTIDRPVEYTIHQPSADNSGGGDNRIHNRLYIFADVAKNVIIRNLRFGIDRSFDENMLPDMTIDIQHAINVTLENLEFNTALAVVARQGAENVILRNVTQFGQAYRAQAYHGRTLGGWSSSNVIAENLICATDNPKGDAVFIEAQNVNMHIVNVQAHCISDTNKQLWYPVGSALETDRPVQIENIVMENLLMNAPVGSKMAIGSTHSRKNGASVEFRNLCCRNTGSLLRHGMARSLRIYDDQTSSSTVGQGFEGDPPADRYLVYDARRSVNYLTRIDLTDTMSDDEFVIGRGLAVSQIGIYVSDKTGLTLCKLKTSASTDATSVLTALTAGVWVEPYLVTDVYPPDDTAAFGYAPVMNRYVDSTYMNKVMRIRTTTVTPGAYILVSATCWLDEVMDVNETTFSTQDVQQIRYRLGVDGTKVTPTDVAGGKLYDVDGKTPQEAARINSAVLAGKIGDAGGTTETYVGLDGVTTRVVASVDGTGNRSSVSYP